MKSGRRRISEYRPELGKVFFAEFVLSEVGFFASLRMIKERHS
jgi:hypothetical protein